MEILSLLTIIAYLIFLSFRVSLGNDSISLSNSLLDGMTIVSKGQVFELGFFSPGNSKNRYVGIWYKNIPIQTVVWVANRANPIHDSSGILTINNTGNLVLTHNNNTLVWCTTTQKQAHNPVAQLLDSGNLVARDENEESSEIYFWQSFDYPSDTLLPGMKLGWDLRIGLNRNVTAWKSPDDPAPGGFSWGLKLSNYPESCMMKGDKMYFRSGPWNGLYPSGIPELVPETLFDIKFISNEDEIYYIHNVKKQSLVSRWVLNQTTYLRYVYVWEEAKRIWVASLPQPLDYCDNYGTCGVNGICTVTKSPVCQCLKGFRPKSPQAWNSWDWLEGCVRNKPLGCKNNNSTDGFIKLERIKLPETTHTWVDKMIGLEECKIKCLNNCSCMAYANSDIRGSGSGCVMWFGDLMDIREHSRGGQDLYIRIDASELEAENGGKKKLTIIVALIISAICGMLLSGSYYIYRVRRNMAGDQNNEDEEDLDLPLYDLSRIATATDNFSLMNKIGEGGFGAVYKGRLESGQEIAVKRLSKSSTQGMIEFKNEVKLIAKLQHRNLVKLLGCCIQGQEKLLVYEYMPNASLDCFIFDHFRGKLLDWPRRFNIIWGIARGLLYLHQDSRLRIIHRDLKASNILLDDKLNPKISDFGLAKIFGGDQIEGNTKRVAGTYGYMAPEYALDGLFSVKSDVFSFGILILEIICGKRNRSLSHSDDSHNLVGQVWKMWKANKALELVDTNLRNSYNVSEVLRCIHVSLLCVQQFPNDRPTMSSVVLILGGEKELVEPKLPGFFQKEDSVEASSPSSKEATSSINEITITLFEAR